jgi:hypothetical protein
MCICGALKTIAKKLLPILGATVLGALLLGVSACGSSSGVSPTTSSVSTELASVSTSVDTPAARSDATESTVGRIIRGTGLHKAQSFDPEWVYERCDAVVLGRVLEELPFRRNPLAGQPDTESADGTIEHFPIVYKGYVIEVEEAFGPESIPRIITVYAMGTGVFVDENGDKYQVVEDYALDLVEGDVTFVPLGKFPEFGTPPLKEDEFWAGAPQVAVTVNSDTTVRWVMGGESRSNTHGLEGLKAIAENSLSRSLVE